MKTVKIYSLSSSKDPQNIRYIGKTVSKLCKRFAGHKQAALNYKENTHLYKWYRKEVSKGNEIKMQLIEEISIDKYNKNETSWIAKYKSLGFDLTNHKKGDENRLLPDKKFNYSEGSLDNIRKAASETHKSRIRCRNGEAKERCIKRLSGVKQDKSSINKRTKTILSKYPNGFNFGKLKVELYNNNEKEKEFETLTECARYLNISTSHASKIKNRNFPLYGIYKIKTV